MELISRTAEAFILGISTSLFVATSVSAVAPPARHDSEVLSSTIRPSAVATAIEPVAEHRAYRSDLHVPVLMYHRVTRAPATAALPGLWVTPTLLERQLRALKRRGWRTITASQLARHLRERRPVGRKRFVITFDDGDPDGYHKAAPILERLGMHGTFCVNPGKASKSWKMSFRQMRRLSASGHEIANHSLMHSSLPALGKRRLRKQIRGAQRLIEREVGMRPVTICYPYGHHSKRVRRIAGRAGLILGFTTADGARQTPSRRLRAPRIRINGWDTPATVVAKLAPYR